MGDEIREVTYGEKAVGITFNPGGDTDVAEVKSAYAKIIDGLNSMIAPDGPAGRNGKNRLIEIAVTEAQAAQMWAVKAITWKD